MKKIQIFLLFCLSLFASPAMAGSDAASVPDDMIPWSGYWWSLTDGKLVNGYLGHPSPIEKYDAYVNGFYPADATEWGLENVYNPDASLWAGYCDDWAAASVLASEPDHAGELNGIRFRVGDKKGLLTLYYDQNYEIVLYGERYSEEDKETDINDIYPGGTQGFHQILINYISDQGVPVIMELDPSGQIWNYPAYRYEMEWYDEGNKRHVTCMVWFADDLVYPDFVGLQPFVKTYTYWLEIDENGNIKDSPGGWEGKSIDDHPDFIWYPVFFGNKSFLKDDVIAEIIACEYNQSNDRFEENNTRESAYLIKDLQKELFYCASAYDDDWFKVMLQQGDDFTVNAAIEEINSEYIINIDIFNAAGEQVGTKLTDGVRLAEVSESAYYYIKISSNSETPYYRIQFFQSPMAVIPHTPVTNGWNTLITILNNETENQNLRLNLFDNKGNLTTTKEMILPSGKLETYSFQDMFLSSDDLLFAFAKLINLEGTGCPKGFFSYEEATGRVNLPLDENMTDTLYIPHLAVSEGWWTGLAIANPNAVNPVKINIKAYTSDGYITAENIIELGAGENKTDFIQSYLNNNIIPENTAWMALVADGNITGCLLWGNNSDMTNIGVSGILLIDERKIAPRLYIPHLAVGSEWWTGIVLINPGDEISPVTLNGYSSDGNLVQTGKINIPAYGNRACFVQELFSEWNDKISWIKIFADRPLGGFQIFGRGNGDLAASILPNYQDETAEVWMNHISVDKGWSGLAMLNPSETVKTDIWAVPYDADGTRLLQDGKYLWYNAPAGLGMQNNKSGVLENFFPGLPSETAYLNIMSEEPVVTLGLYEDINKKMLDVSIGN